MLESFGENDLALGLESSDQVTRLFSTVRGSGWPTLNTHLMGRVLAIRYRERY